ncbi:hypothetical protein K5D34_01745 [Pseudomonas cichorii]|uniref:Membrane-anchored ribosome-binding protein, inhibits growth in stationary phase, ElaB/YqjD/DUF883 family n=1 Tax=Pseudomonas lijiangensis TaxID=2995658 RepID=A0ABX8HLB0_9PSED|nr:MULTISPECIES: hypothetical protein [Pseudomonas syringae group]MBX8491384.1 hypothetical protein [Pseudomonas cichorii]MBX8499553.1 hypothetical protein [Pseudomonas lijiangensis]MBX8505327.1 hypothetical protein [Pseudomonas lijiangensis]MBX8508415.1 hypothetical protein [Pseudomonas cichorii]MBX8519816.1 hypothetical protein [Pseudomonas cichorii]
MATINDPTISGSRPTGQEPLSGLHDDTLNPLDQTKEQDNAPFDQYRDTAADQIDNLANDAQSAARQISDNDTLGLSRYVSDIAQGLNGLAEKLRGKNTDELLQDAGKLARDNPMLFIGGSVALGLGLSRLLKASIPATDSTSSASDTAYDPISPSTLAAEEMVATHPHSDDVLHSARPGMGIPDSPAATEFNDDPVDDLSRTGSTGNDLPKGGV